MCVSLLERGGGKGVGGRTARKEEEGGMEGEEEEEEVGARGRTERTEREEREEVGGRRRELTDAA